MLFIVLFQTHTACICGIPRQVEGEWKSMLACQCMHASACMHTCIHAYMHADECMCACMHWHACTSSLLRIHACTHTCTQTCMCRDGAREGGTRLNILGGLVEGEVPLPPHSPTALSLFLSVCLFLSVSLSLSVSFSPFLALFKTRGRV